MLDRLALPALPVLPGDEPSCATPSIPAPVTACAIPSIRGRGRLRLVLAAERDGERYHTREGPPLASVSLAAR